MEAKLFLYKDCTSEEPYKTYTCRRLTLGVSKAVGSLLEQMDGKSEAEQMKLTIKVIKSIFPTFKDEEFDYIDPLNWAEFVSAINNETNLIVRGAQKN